MQHCQACGTPAASSAHFCPACGAELAGTRPDDTRRLDRDALDQRSPAGSGQPPGAEPARSGNRRGLRVAALGVVILVAAAGGSWGGVWLSTELGGGSGDPSASVDDAATASPAPTPTPTPTPTETATDDATPAEQDFATLWDRTSSGVVKLDVARCFEAGGGSGFLVEDGYVVTNAHVVADAARVDVVARGATTPAEVLGVDDELDLALVDPASSLSGHRFQFSETAPDVGDEVAALGFPLGGDATMTRGTVSSERRTVDFLATPVLQTDTSINPGNSGGPLIDRRGRVVGVVVAKRAWATPEVAAEGIGFAIPADTAARTIASMADRPRPRPAADCARQAPAPDGADSVAAELSAVLADYYAGINRGDYQRSWDQLTPSFRDELGTLQGWAEGQRTSYLTDVQPRDVSQRDGAWQVEVTFTSLQDPSHGPDGESCTRWHLRYSFVQVDGTWLIDDVEPVTGEGHRPCG